MSDNLAKLAWDGKLTESDVKNATLKKLMEDMTSGGNTVLYWASCKCPTEVAEVILDKGVPINQLSGPVSYYLIVVL
jgi:hypothetical protein